MSTIEKCSECNSSAISSVPKSGFNNLYKCESCGCLLQLEKAHKFSLPLILLLLTVIIISLSVARYFGELIFSIFLGTLLIAFPLVIVVFGMKNLLSKRSFKKLVK